jgi:microcystin-dependent protein
MQARFRRGARFAGVVALGMGFGILASSRAEASCVPQPYLASICITAASFCPKGYLDASGQMLPIAQNTALFSLIGTTYGGDGKVTFALPKLNGVVRPPMRALRHCIAVYGAWPPQ